MTRPIEIQIPLKKDEAPGALAAKGTSFRSTTALWYQPGANPDSDARQTLGATLILAHGAGAGQRHPFLTEFARGLSAQGLDVVTFDFPYMAEGRRLPDRGPVLEACYRTVIELVCVEVETARRHLFIGGKSMGGRIATQAAASDRDIPLAGLVMIGYPLHPPNRTPTAKRAAHLPGVGRPMLFVQGSRDSFGGPAELEAALVGVVPTPTIHAVAGGDHSLSVPRRGATPQADVYAEVQTTIARWVESIIEG